MSDVPFVQIRGLGKVYRQGENRVEVLKGIDMAVARGEGISIVGASGVGKSTLLHILGTLDEPTSGAVLFSGRDVFRMEERELCRFRNETVGFVFQFHHLLPQFTALENAAMPGLIRGAARRQAFAMAEERLREVGLAHRLHHHPGELSGGEQQRVAIARALLFRPPLILADEPTGNLDTHTAEQVQDLLLDLHDRHGATLVVVTHNERLAGKLSRRIRLEDGRIAEPAAAAAAP